jgi:hypothetical protein
MAERSPRYPGMSLGEAISRAKSIYEREHLSSLTPTVAAEAMGYKGISGTSLRAIASLRQYGLLEGRGDDVKLSKDAQTIIIDDPGTADYRNAIRRAAFNPSLFSDLRKQFPGPASERNIAVYLEKKGFKPDGAAMAAKNYKDSMALVPSESEGYSTSEEGQAPSDGGPMPAEQTTARTGRPSFIDTPPPVPQTAPVRVMMSGNRLDIQASVDLEGLKKLQAMLQKYQGILEMMEPEKKEATN